MTAEDLDGQDRTFTITNVDQIELGKEKKEMKLLVSLRGEKKGFVCNKTNAKKIAEITGCHDTDDWNGKTIKLGPREVQFGEDLVWSIRVISPPPQRSRPAGQASQAPAGEEYADEMTQTGRRRSDNDLDHP